MNISSLNPTSPHGHSANFNNYPINNGGNPNININGYGTSNTPTKMLPFISNKGTFLNHPSMGMGQGLSSPYGSERITFQQPYNVSGKPPIMNSHSNMNTRSN